jgi:DGQHR domain-containing protein
MAKKEDGDRDEIQDLDRTKPLRYSVSLVKQVKHRFYTLTMPSDILSKTCFVTTREADADEGFQRVLDKERAQQIADYIDSGLGTIPSSIVLSAQPEANLRDIGKGKTIEFTPARKSFLIIDGQHRVYGFSLAKTLLRVPVVIYNGLSKRDESRLFIDINTKQKPVPNELLLDIKKLAEYETDAERLFGEVYDLFHEQPSSPLFGLTSPISRSSGKISRVTFNAALRPLLEVFSNSDSEQVYKVLSEYIRAFKGEAEANKIGKAITNPVVFRAAMLLFPQIGGRLKDKGKPYTTDNFVTVLKPMLNRVKASTLLNTKSVSDLLEYLSKTLQKEFTL